MADGLPTDNSKYLYYFLIFAVFAGIFARFWGIGESWLEGDEPLNMIAGIKLNHDGNPYDARLFSYEHPPVARWFIGLPTRFIDADYSASINLPVNMFVWSYVAPVKEIYVPMRLVSATFGALSVLLIFLITRKLFGVKAGIWSAVSASLSFDLIFYSRWVLPESVTVGLTLLTIYLYLLYLEGKTPLKRLTLMIATVVSLTLTLGTRAFTPLFLIPALILSQIIANRDKPKENLIFIILVFIGAYLFMTILWPPEVRSLAQKMWGVYGISDMLAFSLPEVILVNVFRNSYLYVLGLIFLVYGACRLWQKTGGIGIEPVLKYLKNANHSLVVIIFLVVSLIGFSVTKYAQVRYEVLLFIPIFILSGNVFEKASRSKALSKVIIFLILVNFYFLAKAYPYYSEYQNFSLGKCGEYAIGCGTAGAQNHAPELRQAMSYLEKMDNPPIMTTEFNVLTFYDGSSIPLIASYDTKCNKKDVEVSAKMYGYIIYWGGRSSQSDIRTDPYVCEYLRKMPMDEVQSFGNYTQAGVDAESLKVKVYLIKA